MHGAAPAWQCGNQDKMLDLLHLHADDADSICRQSTASVPCDIISACVAAAGMEEGGICCWDLAEPNAAHSSAGQGARTRSQHTQHHQQQQHAASLELPARRPSYSTEVPFLSRDSFATAAAHSEATSEALAKASAATPQSSSTHDSSHVQLQGAAASMVLQDAGLAAGGVVALSAVAGASSNSGGAGGGPVCKLVVLSAGGCVTLYSVMLGGAGSDVAVTDLGMRTGEGQRCVSTQLTYARVIGVHLRNLKQCG